MSWPDLSEERPGTDIALCDGSDDAIAATNDAYVSPRFG
jgi:hypothetical protein